MPGRRHLPKSASMVERLGRLFKAVHGDDNVLVVIEADPDAISAAMALKRLFWRRVNGVTIACTNQIKRTDNLAMIRLLKAPLSRLAELDPGGFNRLALVDSQPHHHEAMAGLDFDIIIDHHPFREIKAGFLDVRPEYGATATMMTEYLRAANIKPSQHLATALFYGIKTDTNNFARQGQAADMRAFRFLFPYANLNLINKIENSGLSHKSLRYFETALKSASIRKGLAVVVLEKVDSPDTLVQLADFFMRVDDVNQSLAAGVCQDQLVIIFRSVGLRRNAGGFMARAFGEFGPAGGHRSMARAELPLAKIPDRWRQKAGGLKRFVMNRIKA